MNDLGEKEIRAALTARREPAYRAKQICEWLYRRRAKTFDEMTNLPAALRAELAGSFTIIRLEKTKEMVSAKDGTIKFLLRLPDGNHIESVFLPHPRGATLCISTQVGCAFGCRFCATGKMGLKRDLSPGEIVDQVLFTKEYLEARIGAGRTGLEGPILEAQDRQRSDPDLPDEDERAGRHAGAQASEGARPFTNIVLMGMGEPLANYENVVKAIEILIKEAGIGARRITVSTAGVADKIMQLADLPYEIGLAISLNSPNDDIRREIMPVAGRTPLSKLLAAARYYYAKQGRMLTFEYVLIPDLNDSIRDAHALADLLRDLPAKINLIMVNPFPGCPYMRVGETNVKRFESILHQRGKKATLRRSLGCDILAGCGQLGQDLK
ncbi:MAG: 23S rRNA (adenine(2503)-C(2))-methyltransferase RlmN [Candidatus Eisenbacteria bacterium]